ncbi:MAG: cell division protein FtsW, partial [Actinobacteria bacterium]|nr:cell division protein FtsW [Actinomycetota bacterium]
FALLFALFVPGLGVSVNGNRNWIEFGGPFRLQPSEFAKFALVVWAASLLARKEAEGRDWAYVLQRMAVVAGGMLLLVIVSGDLGTSLVLMAVTVALMFFAGIPMRILGILVAAGLAGIAYLSASHGYRRDRFTSWLDPSSDPLGAGWQALHGTYALASGGWWGVGLGASREKWGDLPEAHTDFIFAVIGEEFGLFGTLIVLALLTAICVSGVVVALRTQDTFVRLAAAGAVTWIAVQAIVNIGAVLQLLPITGIPLPLVSYGGSALIPTMCVIGMLLTFARREPEAAAAFALRGPGPIRRLLAEPARRPDLRSVTEQGS